MEHHWLQKHKHDRQNKMTTICAYCSVILALMKASYKYGEAHATLPSADEANGGHGDLRIMRYRAYQEKYSKIVCQAERCDKALAVSVKD